MTCAEKYLSEHPGEWIKGCPQDYGYVEKPENCYSISCHKDCWAREVPEKKKGEHV